MHEITFLTDVITIELSTPFKRRKLGRLGRVVRWVALTSIAGIVAWVALAGAGGAVRQARREQCAGQLKRLGRALLGYQDAHGQFPAPAVAGRKGAPGLSWRVAILPQLGYGSLYARFHLDEPWDSPHNLALLKEMPPEFSCPSGPGRRAGKTGYLVVVGPDSDAYSVNTAFEPGRGVDVREIIDGTSVTLLVLETDSLVPWTKPDDFQWAQGGPPPRLRSPHAGGTHVLMADGSTRFLKSSFDPNILLAILTINGSEVTSES